MRKWQLLWNGCPRTEKGQGSRHSCVGAGVMYALAPHFFYTGRRSLAPSCINTVKPTCDLSLDSHRNDLSYLLIDLLIVISRSELNLWGPQT